jgi:hypothetical protein
MAARLATHGRRIGPCAIIARCQRRESGYLVGELPASSADRDKDRSAPAKAKVSAKGETFGPHSFPDLKEATA